jgi:hypothetical protein
VVDLAMAAGIQDMWAPRRTSRGKPPPPNDAEGDLVLGATLPASIYRSVMAETSVGAPGADFPFPVFSGEPKTGNFP